MKFYSNPRSLPVQLRILVPIIDPEFVESVFKLFREHMPSISCQLYLLGLTDRKNIKDHLNLHRDIQALANQYLSGIYYDVVIKYGKNTTVVSSSALQYSCDLVVLSNPRESKTKLSNLSTAVSSFLSLPSVPVLILPNTTDQKLPLKKVLVHLNPDESSRLATAFALRSARLLCSDIVLTASSKSKNDAGDYLAFVKERYLTPDSADQFLTHVEASRPTRLLLNSSKQHEPDFAIISLQDYSTLTRKKLMTGAITLSQKNLVPVLIVNRYNWYHKQEKIMSSIYNNLTEFDLAHSEDNHSPEKALSFSSLKTPELFLGFYTHQGLLKAFNQYGLSRILTHKGYPSPYITFNILEGNRERLRVYPSKTDCNEPLVDIVVKIDHNPSWNSDKLNLPVLTSPCLYVEWLCLQDPKRSYRDLEIPLPGQKFPGLGIGWKVMIIIKLLARRIGAAAIYNMPEYYHTARLYHRFFRYADPNLEGRLQAIDRDTFPLHVVDTSWAFIHGLVHQNNRPAEWLPGPQILPLNTQLQAYFKSEYYCKHARNEMISSRFSLDKPELDAMIKNRKLYSEPGSG